MADEKKPDIFAETTPAGLAAYPQMIYEETKDKHPNGAPIMKQLGVAKNPDEHKKMLAGQKGWGKG